MSCRKVITILSNVSGSKVFRIMKDILREQLSSSLKNVITNIDHAAWIVLKMPGTDGRSLDGFKT